MQKAESRQEDQIHTCANKWDHEWVTMTTAWDKYPPSWSLGHNSDLIDLVTVGNSSMSVFDICASP